MSVELLRGLLRDLGGAIGLPDLEPDEEGYCSLRIGEQVTITIQYEPERNDLAVFASLAAVPDEVRADACEMMLAANLFWTGTRGMTLAFEPGQGMAYLQVKEPIQSLDVTRFTALLEEFVETAEDWIDRLRTLAGDASPAVGEPPIERFPTEHMRLV